jgi:hypothetical protein
VNRTDNTDLTKQEQANVRAALRFLHVRLGTWEMVAKALRFKRSTIMDSVSGAVVSASLAFRTARLAGVPVDDVLAGRFPPAGTCPMCGHASDRA